MSIITINYNNFLGLKSTVESLSKFDKSLFEHIVIDGNSSDKSVEYLNKNKALFDVLRIEPDEGIYSAMNKGISLAQGQYLWFLNSGDIVNAEFDLFDFYQMILDLNFPDAVYSDVLVSYPNGFKRTKKAEDLKQFRFKLPFSHQAVMVKLKFHQEKAFDLNYKIVADFDFFLELYLSKVQFSKYHTPFAEITAGGKSEHAPISVFTEKWKIQRKYNCGYKIKLALITELLIRKFVSLIKALLPNSFGRQILRMKYLLKDSKNA